jgi:hypothetical protein
MESISNFSKKERSKIHFTGLWNSFWIGTKAFRNNVEWQRMRSSSHRKILFVNEYIHWTVERVLQVKDKFPYFYECIFFRSFSRTFFTGLHRKTMLSPKYFIISSSKVLSLFLVYYNFKKFCDRCVPYSIRKSSFDTLKKHPSTSSGLKKSV